MFTTQQVKADFDELADLVADGESGTDHYDQFLLSLVPVSAQSVLDVGCGMGRLTRALSASDRVVLGLDLSPRMIERARAASHASAATFIEGDFLELDLGDRRFDCVVSAAALHHMHAAPALRRMSDLLQPGGRLIVHDLRRNSGIGDGLRSYSALAKSILSRFVRSGRLLPPKRVRQAWDRHGSREEYLSWAEATALASRELPGSVVYYQWLWRYTLVWDKPFAGSSTPTPRSAGR